MTLEAAIEAELPFLRAEAEALMTDTGTAKRPTGGYVFDPAANGGTGGDVEATSDLFTSACKIQDGGLALREAEVGGRTSVSSRPQLHLPVSTSPLTVGDLFAITAVAAHSSVPVGRVYRVLGPVEKSWPTARRYDVEAVVS